MITVIGAGDVQTFDKKSLLLIGSVVASLGAYVCLLNVIGLVMMFICGERHLFSYP
jgi:hypothetical protein